MPNAAERPAPRPPARYSPVVRCFPTAGPVVAADHYHLPPLQRTGADTLLRLVEAKNYFVVYAPRQTGKTTSLRALCEVLNERGYRAVHANLQSASTVSDNLPRAMRAVLTRLASRAERTLDDDYLDREWPGLLDRYGPESAVEEALTRWAGADSKPLVLVLDEVDALRGEALLCLLHQLRSGYEARPDGFPHSIVVCGLRNVRDYFASQASPFNIVAKSLRLGDFSETEVRALLGQHTEETGQRFTDEAAQEIWRSTNGQPWLVNALAYGACFEDPEGLDRSRDLGPTMIAAARERLILEGPAHFGQIAHRLKEDRVRKVLDPILAGVEGRPDFTDDDARYVNDLGLVTGTPSVRIANPIYGEVIPRLLADEVEHRILLDDSRFVRADRGLEVPALLRAFQSFFRENAEWWLRDSPFHEYGAQVLLQAFLQRVVNAGGHITREHGLGRGRTDLLISWRKGSEPQVFVIECKVRRQRDGLDEVIRRGALQTAGYMDRSGATEGHLLVFDRDERKSWEEKVFHREVRVLREGDDALDTEETGQVLPEAAPPAPGERTIQVWGV